MTVPVSDRISSLGGYAFADYDLGYLGVVNPGAAADIQAYYDGVNAAVAPEGAATLQLGLIHDEALQLLGHCVLDRREVEGAARRRAQVSC